MEKHIIECKNCGKKFEILVNHNDFLKGKHRKFCCSSCSNKRVHSEETKQKISNSLKKPRYCVVCGKEIKDFNSKKYCSIDCKNSVHKKYSEEAIEKMSLGGRNSIKKQHNNRRSKNEIYFYDLCLEHFSNVLHNINMFNNWDADIIINDIKYAILWNGPWHHKQISKHISLEKIKNRDKIKIEEIKKCGYFPYIIDDFGKYNKKFVKQQFDIFLNSIKIAE